MSLNRENVTWPSPDGLWNIGFFEFYQTGEDHEWDVEYDYDHFSWCSVGHATREQANDAWHGPNPGGGEVYTTANEQTARYDRLAAEWQQSKLTAGSRGMGGWR